MKILKILNYVFLILAFTGLKAQVDNSIVLPSPNASSLGKYGSIPVSLYTGVPDISIPIHTIKFRDITLPISLTYNSSGIKVQDEASWVGLGWSLNAGGVITRTIQGKDDLGFEREILNLANTSTFQGFPYDQQVPTGDLTEAYKQSLYFNHIDAAPDNFYFNFAGYTGQFFLKQQSNDPNYLFGTLKNSSNINVLYNKNTHGWELTTPDGFKYYFGTKEYTEKHSGNSSYNFADAQSKESIRSYEDDIDISSWYLDKIVSPTGVQLNFNYDIDATGKSTYVSQSVSSQCDREDLVMFNQDYSSSTGCFPRGLSHLYTSTCNFNGHNYLSSITWDNGSISFKKSNRQDMRMPISNVALYCSMLQNFKYGPQKLDSIQIKDKSGIGIKSFILGYGYFNNSHSGSDSYLYERLKLNTVTEYAKNNIDHNPPYNFLYEETILLPSKASLGQDFWGYYNGQDANYSFIPGGSTLFFMPGLTQFFQLGDANRFPDSNHVQAGILKQITYPTGGSTQFKYEQNDYYSFGTGAWDITNVAPPILDTPEAYAGDWPQGGDTTQANIDTASFTISSTTLVTFDIIIDYYPKDEWNQCPSPYTYYKLGTIWGQDCITMNDATGHQYFRRNFTSWEDRTDTASGTYGQTLTLTLPAGTYTMWVKSYRYWDIYCNASYVDPMSATMKNNANGIYAYQGSGLRIAKITDIPVNGTNTVKKYIYNTNGISTGKLMMFPTHHVEYCNSSSTESSTGGECTVTYYLLEGSSWSNIPLSTSGTIIGYDQVTVLSDENGINGTEESYFVNNVETLPSGPVILGFPNNFDPSNGLLSTQYKFDANEKLINKITYSNNVQLLDNTIGLGYYTPISLLWTMCIDVENQIICGTIDFGYKYLVSNTYTVYSTRNDITLKEEILNTANNTSITTDINYVYNSLGQVSSETTTNSNGLVKNISKHYPVDFTNTSYAPLKLMQSNNMVNFVIEQQEWENSNLVAATFNQYANFGSSSNIPRLSCVYQLETTTPLSSTSFIGLDNNGILKSGTQYKPRIIFNYDNNLNIISQQKTNDFQTSYIWGYNNALPIAEVKNATADKIAYTSFYALNEGSWNYTSGTIISSTASKTGNSYFSFSGTNVITRSITPGSYILEYWAKSAITASGGTITDISTSSPDANGWILYRKKVVIASNTTLSLSASSSTSIDELRLYPSDAQMTTYTYDPLFGMTSKTDENNVTTYYIYDSFGRLQDIKDSNGKVLKHYEYNYKH